MDQKSKFNPKGREGLSNEESRSKTSVLDNFHHMEWMKNKQDSRNLSRSNSRTSYDVQETKKHKEEEENYFVGSGNQKTKKTRKLRPSENNVQVKVPHGFSMSASSSGPPPVNAWAQKRGSALFTKPPEAVDEEDEMLKQALQESLKTAAKEDQKRQHFERLRSMEAPPPAPAPAVHTENVWEDDYDEEEHSAPTTGPPIQPQKPDLQFIHTDTVDESPNFNQKRKFVPPRARKVCRQQENVSLPAVKSFCSPEPPSSSEIFQHPTGHNKNIDDNFEPSRPIEKLHSAAALNYNDYGNSHPPTSSFGKPISKLEINKEIVSPENVKTVPPVNDLSANLQTILRFGDTQDVFEKIQDNATYTSSTPLTQSCYQFETSSYHPNESNTSVQMPPLKSSHLIDLANCPDITETDIMLHNFIRHDPPSSQVPKTAYGQKTHSVGDVFSLNNPQHYSSPESTHLDKHQTLNGNSKSVSINSSGQDSRSSLASDSPLQNVSPYGSFENHTLSNLAGNLPSAQIPLMFPGNEDSPNNMQDMHIRNQNVASQLTSLNVPPGLVPLNSQLPGVPQYRLPNSGMMLPIQPTPELLNASPQLMQLQHLMAMNVAAMYQFQQTQAQLAALNASDTMEPSQKEQVSAVSHSQINQQNHPQIIQNKIEPQTIQTQNHPQMVPVPNQSQMMHLQNQSDMSPNQPHMVARQNQPHVMPIPNQAHMVPIQNQQRTIPPQNQGQMIFHQNHPQATGIQDSEDVYLNNHQQQVSSQKPVANENEQILPPSGKGNLQQEYWQLMQRLQQLQQAMGNSPVQRPPMPFPPPQQYMYPQHPVAMGLNHFYPGVRVMHPVQQQHSNQVPEVNRSSSPVVFTDRLSNNEENLSNSPDLNMTPELNVAHQSLEPHVGRGRGRLQ